MFASARGERKRSKITKNVSMTLMCEGKKESKKMRELKNNIPFGVYAALRYEVFIVL
jgi:hypothetical protein